MLMCFGLKEMKDRRELNNYRSFFIICYVERMSFDYSMYSYDKVKKQLDISLFFFHELKEHSDIVLMSLSDVIQSFDLSFP